MFVCLSLSYRAIASIVFHDCKVTIIPLCSPMIMTSTPAQNSRYPRPLKATVTFHHHSSPESSPLSYMLSEPPSRIDSLCFTPKLIHSTGIVANTYTHIIIIIAIILTPDHSIDDDGCCSIDDASNMSSIVDQDRRSNSLDSLSEVRVVSHCSNSIIVLSSLGKPLY